MAGRIRSIKPDWLEDQLLAKQDDATRVLSVALILLADDYGNGRAHPSYVQANAWTYNASPETLERAFVSLVKLRAIRFIEVYEVDEQLYFHIRSWSKHQKVSHPGQPKIPQQDPHSSVTPERLVKLSGVPPEVLTPDLIWIWNREMPVVTGSEPVGSGPSTSAEEGPVSETQPVQPEAEAPSPHAEPRTSAPQLLLAPTDPAKPSPIDTVFAAYVAGWQTRSKGNRPPKLDSKRRKLIAARLKEFELDDLVSAVRGIWKSDWNVQEKHTKLEQAIRDAGQIERYMAFDSPPVTHTKTASARDWEAELDRRENG